MPECVNNKTGEGLCLSCIRMKAAVGTDSENWSWNRQPAVCLVVPGRMQGRGCSQEHLSPFVGDRDRGCHHLHVPQGPWRQPELAKPAFCGQLGRQRHKQQTTSTRSPAAGTEGINRIIWIYRSHGGLWAACKFTGLTNVSFETWRALLKLAVKENPSSVGLLDSQRDRHRLSSKPCHLHQSDINKSKDDNENSKWLSSSDSLSGVL